MQRIKKNLSLSVYTAESNPNAKLRSRLFVPKCQSMKIRLYLQLTHRLSKKTQTKEVLDSYSLVSTLCDHRGVKYFETHGTDKLGQVPVSSTTEALSSSLSSTKASQHRHDVLMKERERERETFHHLTSLKLLANVTQTS